MVDELDYLIKYLDSFTPDEVAAFQGAAWERKIADLPGLINLAFLLFPGCRRRGFQKFGTGWDLAPACKKYKRRSTRIGSGYCCQDCYSMEYPTSGKEGQRSFGTSITSDPVWDFRGGLHGQLFGCAGIQCRRHPYTAPGRSGPWTGQRRPAGSVSVLAGRRLGALGAVAQIARCCAADPAGRRQDGGELAAEPGCPGWQNRAPYTFSAWDLRFMLSVYADPTRADADRSR